MSRLGCKCGHVMGSTDSPSPYSIYVYYESEVTQAISKNSNLTVMDFLVNWDEKNGCKKQYMKRKEEVDYWYCTECKRVYECQVKIGGHWLRVYQRKEAKSGIAFDKNECVQIFVFSEVYSDSATEENPKVLLSEFVKKLSNAYYANSDESKVYVVDKESGKLLYMYELEEMIPSETDKTLAYN